MDFDDFKDEFIEEEYLDEYEDEDDEFDDEEYEDSDFEDNSDEFDPLYSGSGLYIKSKLFCDILGQYSFFKPFISGTNKDEFDAKGFSNNDRCVYPVTNFLKDLDSFLNVFLMELNDDYIAEYLLVQNFDDSTYGGNQPNRERVLKIIKELEAKKEEVIASIDEAHIWFNIENKQSADDYEMMTENISELYKNIVHQSNPSAPRWAGDDFYVEMHYQFKEKKDNWEIYANFEGEIVHQKSDGLSEKLILIELQQEQNMNEDKKYIVSITGKIEIFPNRKAMAEALQAKGHRFIDSVSSNTEILVNNDNSSASAKNVKARELGIPILTEKEAIEFLKLDVK